MSVQIFVLFWGGRYFRFCVLIDSGTCAGTVWLVDILDAEQQTRHEVRLLVRDQAALAPVGASSFGGDPDGSSPAHAAAFRTATATLVLNVIDVNDNPVLHASYTYFFTLYTCNMVD